MVNAGVGPLRRVLARYHPMYKDDECMSCLFFERVPPFTVSVRFRYTDNMDMCDYTNDLGMDTIIKVHNTNSSATISSLRAPYLCFLAYTKRSS